MPERSAVTSTLMRFLPHRRRPPWQGVLIGLGCALLAYVLRALLDPLILGVPFVTFFPFLVVATIWGGGWAGTTTLLLGALIGAYAWLPPRGTLNLGFRAAVSVAAYLVAGASVVVSLSLVNETIAALRRSEARSAMFAKEMQHRVKNVLALVQAISRVTARGGGTAEEHQDRLSERIQALAAAGDARRAAPHLPVDLDDLLRRILMPFGLAHFAFVGPPSSVTDEIGSTLGLALYELATNAAKHGALSTQNGRVTLRWKTAGSLVDLVWKETGGPAVIPPTRQGFGSTLLKTAFSSEGGVAELSYEADGVRCRLCFPAAA
jgi:two-component sensor histidine kinase